MLEMAVYKKDPKTGRNMLIEKIEGDISQVQIQARMHHQEQMSIIEKNLKVFNDKVF